MRERGMLAPRRLKRPLAGAALIIDNGGPIR